MACQSLNINVFFTVFPTVCKLNDTHFTLKNCSYCCYWQYIYIYNIYQTFNKLHTCNMWVCKVELNSDSNIFSSPSSLKIVNIKALKI